MPHLDARDVVRGVAHECLDVYPQLGVRQLLLCIEALQRVQVSVRARSLHDRHSRAQQLVEVLQRKQAHSGTVRVGLSAEVGA